MSSTGAGESRGELPRRLRALARRGWKVLRVNWHLGVTAFGGPPVHFKIVSIKKKKNCRENRSEDQLLIIVRRVVQRKVRPKVKMGR